MSNHRACWIWIPEWNNKDQRKTHLVYFRKAFQLKVIPLSCKIQVSADTRYKLYVNGKLADLGPVKGDHFVWYADTIEIAPFLHTGENVLAAEVLRYPIERTEGNYGMFRTETPGFFVSEMETELDLDTGNTWKCICEDQFNIVRESELFAPLRILEERKGDKKKCGWKIPYYDDSLWRMAAEYADHAIPLSVSPGNLYPRPIPSMFLRPRHFKDIIKRRKSGISSEIWREMLSGRGQVIIPPFTEEIIEIDAGAETTGYLSLKGIGGKGTVIHILTAECYVQKELDSDKLKDPFYLPPKGDRCDFENGYLNGFTDTYQVAGYGTGAFSEDYEPFWFRTFRFVQLAIRTKEEAFVLRGFDYMETGYPLEVRTKVNTSDETLKPVWDISLRSLQCCMHETYEDCPFYEQLQYAMDARSQILYTYTVSGDARLARKCMNDFKRSQRYDGMINSAYPSVMPNVIPGFSVFYILMLHDYMMYFGDRTFLLEHLPSVDRILAFFHAHLDGRGLVKKIGDVNGNGKFWSFIDWTTQWDSFTGVPSAIDFGPLTMESLLYLYGLLTAADLAEYTGKHEQASEYRMRSDKLKESLLEYCIDKDGFVTDGPGVSMYSQHCQVFAVLTDVLPKEQGKRNLIHSLDYPDVFAQCSVAMSFYLFRALEKTGLYDKTDACWDIWREMIRDNLTTCVEDNVKKRSDCHAWGALALYELPAVVLGVRPAGPGFSKISIMPHPGHMSWAKGNVYTPKGNVIVDWSKDKDGTIHLQYQAPSGIEVILNQSSQDQIT